MARYRASVSRTSALLRPLAENRQHRRKQHASTDYERTNRSDRELNPEPEIADDLFRADL